MGNKPALALCAAALASCAVYPPERDTTQPDKIKKAMLVCADQNQKWPECGKGAPAQWYFRPTTIKAPFEAWWTFEGEQGDTHRISWEISEKMLVAYRTYETTKGANGFEASAPRHKGQPIAAWPITSHFDVWHQYNPTTGEQLPVLYESMERPWYQREYVRVDWSRNLITGFGFFMGSKLTQLLEPGALVAEPAVYAVTDPADPDYRILSNDYIDVAARETVTPMSGGSYSTYFSGSPVSEVTYRYSFMRADKRDYQAFYYPDPAFEKFGYFRKERDVYDSERGLVDFKDYLLERWNVWARVHSDKACSTHAECDGGAEAGVTCDLFQRDADGKGRCTLPYVERGLKSVTYYLSPDFPEARFGRESCMIVQGWNVALKQTVAKLLNVAYTPPALDDQFAANCSIDAFVPLNGETQVDLNRQDLFVLKRNSKSCDEFGVPGKGDRWCQRMGDLRYSMLYYIHKPSLGSPLGYGPVASDPETGEIIQGNSFIYGAALDSYESYVGDVYDLVTGEVSDLEIRTGENVREYYQNLSGNVFPPTVPQQNFREAGQEQAQLQKLDDLRERLQGFKEKMEQLKRMGPAARSPYFGKLAGSSIERALVDNLEWKSQFHVGDRDLGDADLERMSPFRAGFWNEAHKHDQVEQLLSRSDNCLYRADEYTDNTVSWLAEQYARQGLLRDDAVERIMRAVYRGVTEHEVGHNMGLRHNFEASFDKPNFFPEYFDILQNADAEQREPNPADFCGKAGARDCTDPLPLTPAEYEQYDAARYAARQARERAGSKMYQYSSIMDYGGQFYSDFRGLGRYDMAAIKFGYGPVVEVFDGAPDETRSNRQDRFWYAGGEACEPGHDEQCPFAGIGQKCQPGARAGKGVCSSWDADAAAKASDEPPVKYRFCSDERTTDRPFCNRFDEGASSVEIVENLIDTYERNYVFNNFRRYRATFSTGAYANRIWSRYFNTMAKQYASLLYQLYYSRDAMVSDDSGTFADMLGASVKAMNFFARVLSTPDVGAYRRVALDTKDGKQNWVYRRYNYDCNASGADLSACLGVGKHYWSVWEQGYYGQIERQSRVGIYIDKIYALLALTNRNWGNPQANDETFPLSFYDGFKGELLDLFSGIISADIRRYAPAVEVDPQNSVAHVRYRDLWTGGFFGQNATGYFYNTTPVVSYPQNPGARYDNADLLDPEGNSTWMRLYALIFSLQSWPSYFDATYADYLQLYGFGRPEVRYPDDAMTISYVSPRRGKTYSAVQTPDGKSIIYPLVAEAARIKTDYDLYSGMTPQQAEAANLKGKFASICPESSTPTHEACRQRVVENLGNQLDDRESFLNQVLELRTLMLGAGLQ